MLQQELASASALELTARRWIGVSCLRAAMATPSPTHSARYGGALPKKQPSCGSDVQHAKCAVRLRPQQLPMEPKHCKHCRKAETVAA